MRIRNNRSSSNSFQLSPSKIFFPATKKFIEMKLKLILFFKDKEVVAEAKINQR